MVFLLFVIVKNLMGELLLGGSIYSSIILWFLTALSIGLVGVSGVFIMVIKMWVFVCLEGSLVVLVIVYRIIIVFAKLVLGVMVTLLLSMVVVFWSFSIEVFMMVSGSGLYGLKLLVSILTMEGLFVCALGVLLLFVMGRVCIFFLGFIVLFVLVLVLFLLAVFFFKIEILIILSTGLFVLLEIVSVMFSMVLFGRSFEVVIVRMLLVMIVFRFLWGVLMTF